MVTYERKRGFTVEAIQTEVFQIGMSLTQFVAESVPNELIKEESVLAITSKIVSLAEGQIVAKDSIEKADLIKQECDFDLGKINYDCHLTIKHGALLPAAGIDESNSQNGDFILLPKDPYASAQKLHSDLCKMWSIKRLGLLITDSHTSPLRRGVTGLALSHWGFAALIDKRGQTDLFSREMKMTTINTADALSTAAVWCMGEADDRCPLAILQGADLDWTDSSDRSEFMIAPEEDLYAPLFEHHLKGSIC